jgi:glycogen debranching enzyme
MTTPSPIPQPYLHELVTCVHAPTVALSGVDGQIRAGGTQGAFRHDSRVLSELVVDVDGQEPVAVGYDEPAAGTARFTSVVRHLGDPTADPTVRIERERYVDSDGMRERVALLNTSRGTISATVRVSVAVDFAAMDAVKHGEVTAGSEPDVSAPDTIGWTGRRARSTLRTTQPPQRRVEPGGRVRLTWQVTLPAHTTWAVDLVVSATSLEVDPAQTFLPAVGSGWLPVTATGPRDLVRLLERGVADLGALMLADPQSPKDTFAAAGSPWFLTLFGRDSLWTARLTLSLGTDLARGTLHALARRQGTRHDPETAEAPGKIPHEVRCLPQHIVEDKLVYFGTVDATALWVCLLHDAWRWGMPSTEVAELLDPLQAALRWLVEDADADGDGFLEYLDQTGHGLANQGWKDSGDSIQFPDGSIADPPIALSEAQAYAYEAAMCGATLLEAFSRPGADEVRRWGTRLRERFREAFWVSDSRGRFPAIALDGAKRPVDVATSNLGHLLGTGLLTRHEASLVAARLSEPDLDCGFGLRTLSADAAGYNPLSYHGGSVWPHDTAIAVCGLSREGHNQVAASLAAGLLRAAPTFAHRLPELYAGTDARTRLAPLAYPASCRPQAWSAAAVVAVLQAALGLSADVPGGRLTVQPRADFAEFFPLAVSGLQVAGAPLDIAVDAAGHAEVRTTAAVDLDIQPAGVHPRVPRARSRAAESAVPDPD